jgi:hypothetical protein
MITSMFADVLDAEQIEAPAWLFHAKLFETPDPVCW